jgi:outer membrane biosynthesis protein TonB
MAEAIIKPATRRSVAEEPNPATAPEAEAAPVAPSAKTTGIEVAARGTGRRIQARSVPAVIANAHRAGDSRLCGNKYRAANAAANGTIPRATRPALPRQIRPGGFEFPAFSLNLGLP